MWQELNYIWWMIAGYIRVRVVGAEPERLLGEISSQIQLRDITPVSSLSVECALPKWKMEEFEQIIEKNGAKWEMVGSYGLPQYWKKAWGLPLIVCFLVFLLLSSMLIPGRIFFIQVCGNESVSEQQILNAASEVGLSFGAARRELRSEQIKNRLLSTIPSLSWVGVNTQGCVATISVQERKLEPEEREKVPGHIVATRDAVVSSFTVTSGRALCQNGQAVHAGEVLISGFMDLGICTRVEQAEGEVYGMTRRQIHAFLPDEVQCRREKKDAEKRHSIIIGKKRINLYSDSGILYPSCGKMTEVKALTLPGGWKLPVSFVTECYTEYTLASEQRSEELAQQMLLNGAKAQTEQLLVAGEILSQDMEFSHEAGAYTMTGAFECREMIGKRSSGVFIEGDTSDDGKTG